MSTPVTYEGSDLEVLADMPNYYAWIMETFGPHVRGDVVEYGAGIGTVSSRLAPLAASLTLVEPSANLIPPLSARFAATPQVRVLHARLEDHVAALAEQSVDTLVLVNVLEHIEDDRAALQAMFRSLRRGGHLLVFVPALNFLMSKLDRLLGHFRRYHRPDLVSKVSAAGGAVKACRYVDLLGVGPWFLLNTLLGGTKFNPALVTLNDRVVLPMTKGLESIIPAPFGKNLILVAEKA
ncbi:MAG: class I SAM-dependent methyltransferase [Rhodospirillaceae bacterium]|nr:class I SAM-dependent methyltransferase [Rhodospirillaceae bacterium]